MQINILEYLDRTVKDHPQKTAIIDGERRISFRQLNDQASSLALELNKFGHINRVFAVFLPKSIECILSDIAVTYSGNAYMNLDINNPGTRIKNILDLVHPEAIITNNKQLKKVHEISSDIPIINIEEVELNLDSDNKLFNDVRGKIIDTDPLCIINTSGSTGTPKGVILNHKSYIDYTDWAIETFNFTGDEILGVLSPVIFDHYNYEICLMMAKACTLVLLDQKKASFPVLLLEELKKHNIDYIFWVPTIMVNIANMDLLSKVSLPSLKMIWFAGEVFPTKQFNYWRKHLPEATFVNLYGPVETSVDCTYFIVNRELKDDEPIPIGKPCRNTDIIILNEKDEPVGENETGELCVRGTSLAMGYYNDPEKTEKVFIQNPLNRKYPEKIYRTGDLVFRNQEGELIFKGRKDTLIKHLGYRVELAEIEHTLINTLKLIENGCIVYDHVKKEIKLFYEAKEELPLAETRRKIANVLPNYMIPGSYIRFDELPRNASGKIDRSHLSGLTKKLEG